MLKRYRTYKIIATKMSSYRFLHYEKCLYCIKICLPLKDHENFPVNCPLNTEVYVCSIPVIEGFLLNRPKACINWKTGFHRIG